MSSLMRFRSARRRDRAIDAAALSALIVAAHGDIRRRLAAGAALGPFAKAP